MRRNAQALKRTRPSCPQAACSCTTLGWPAQMPRAFASFTTSSTPRKSALKTFPTAPCPSRAPVAPYVPARLQLWEKVGAGPTQAASKLKHHKSNGHLRPNEKRNLEGKKKRRSEEKAAGGRLTCSSFEGLLSTKHRYYGKVLQATAAYPCHYHATTMPGANPRPEKKTGPWRPACQPHATRPARPFSFGKRNPRTQETVGPKVDNDPLSEQLRKKCPWKVQHTAWPLVGIRTRAVHCLKHHYDMIRTYESGETHEFYNSSLRVSENCEHQRKRARACYNDAELYHATQHEPHKIQWRLFSSRCHPRA